jgi:two-component system, LytTR family, response regulator
MFEVQTVSKKAMKQLAINTNISTAKLLVLKRGGIKLSHSSHLVTIPVEKIVRLEGDCNYTVVHTQTKKYVSARTLKHFEGILDENFFIRVHKSHIVNIRYMKDVQPSNSEIKFDEGRPIEVSRRKLKEVVEKFETYNKV